MTKKVVAPTPNLNGNTGDSLIRQCRSIMDAAKELEDIIGKSSDLWHGRNFLPQGSEDAMFRRQVAQDWWFKRRARVTRLHEEVLQIALSIQKHNM